MLVQVNGMGEQWMAWGNSEWHWGIVRVSEDSPSGSLGPFVPDLDTSCPCSCLMRQASAL